MSIAAMAARNMPEVEPPQIRMLRRLATASRIATRCGYVMIPADTWSSTVNTRTAFNRMVNVGADTMGRIIAAKRASPIGSSLARIGCSRVTDVRSVEATAGDNGFGRDRSHRADLGHAGAEPVRPDGAIGVEHDLDHLWIVGTATDFGAELPAHGRHKPAHDVGAGRERRHCGTDTMAGTAIPGRSRRLQLYRRATRLRCCRRSRSKAYKARTRRASGRHAQCRRPGI